MSNDSKSDTHILTNAQIHFLYVFLVAILILLLRLDPHLRSRVVQTTCNIPGVIACGLVLIAYLILAFPLKARKFLDRVSLRMLIYALFFKYVLILHPQILSSS